MKTPDILQTKKNYPTNNYEESLYLASEIQYFLLQRSKNVKKKK